MSALSVLNDQPPLAQLRASTRAPHEALHVHPLLLPLTEGRTTLPQLTAAIRAFYGFHRAGENALRHTDLAGDFADHPHMTWLEEDLTSLGFNAAERDGLPLCPSIRPVATPGEMLGYLYVREGSMLGGQVIARHLTASLGAGPEAGYRYFAGFGPKETGRRWKGFLALLSEAGSSQAAEASDYAAHLFARLEHWLTDSLRQNGTAP